MPYTLPSLLLTDAVFLSLQGNLGPVRVLELGAGTGALSAHLKSALSQMIAVNEGQVCFFSLSPF
jgi:methylase of polypeptide subunit release factors